MADLIDRQAVLDDFTVHAPSMSYNKMFMVEANAPTIDAVEVVRCKDCKHFTPCEEVDGVSWTGYCNYGEFHTDEDDYCSRGERKGGEG